MRLTDGLDWVSSGPEHASAGETRRDETEREEEEDGEGSRLALPLQSSHSPVLPHARAAISHLFPPRQAVKRPPVALWPYGPVGSEGETGGGGAVGWAWEEREEKEKKKWAPLVAGSGSGPGAELRLMIDGLAGAGRRGMQHRLSRRAAEGFCDLQASGGKPGSAQGNRADAMRKRGDAIMRRGRWGGASSSRLRARLCFPGLSLHVSRRGAAGWEMGAGACLSFEALFRRWW